MRSYSPQLTFDMELLQERPQHFETHPDMQSCCAWWSLSMPEISLQQLQRPLAALSTWARYLPMLIVVIRPVLVTGYIDHQVTLGSYATVLENGAYSTHVPSTARGLNPSLTSTALQSSGRSLIPWFPFSFPLSHVIPTFSQYSPNITPKV